MEEHGRRCLGKPRNIDIAYLLHSQSQFVVPCLHKKCSNALTNHLYFEMQQRAQEPLVFRHESLRKLVVTAHPVSRRAGQRRRP